MSIAAKVICDSISPSGVRLTSVQITAHRFILAEINTHRVLSRNYRSSRAVPVKTLLKEVRENPAMPVRWRKNKPGMVGGEDLTDADLSWAKQEWCDAACRAADSAEFLTNRCNLEKGAANRILEPFLYVHGIITATEWENFFHLRCAPDAQPEFHDLACAMRDAIAKSVPNKLDYDAWHLPFLQDGELEDLARNYNWETYLPLSAARCARVSYKTFDGKIAKREDDVALANKLRESGHWSPFEHQATPDVWLDSGAGLAYDLPEEFEGWMVGKHFHRNFNGWAQHRAYYPNS